MSLRAIGVFALAGLAAPALAEVGTSATYSGNVDALLAGFASPGGSSASGSVTRSGIPSGASILSATLYGHSWFDPGSSATATFAGTPLSPIGAFDADGSSQVFAYKWDVTGLVTGNGSYSID